MSFQMVCINKTQDFQYTIKIVGQYATYMSNVQGAKILNRSYYYFLGVSTL